MNSTRRALAKATRRLASLEASGTAEGAREVLLLRGEIEGLRRQAGTSTTTDMAS